MRRFSRPVRFSSTVAYWPASPLDFLDAGEDGGKLDEIGLGDAGNDLGEGGFAGARWAPEDHRGRVIALDLHAQWLAGAYQVLLSDEFVERARAHAIG